MPKQDTIKVMILKRHKKELARCLRRAEKLTKMIERAEKQSPEPAKEEVLDE